MIKRGACWLKQMERHILQVLSLFLSSDVDVIRFLERMNGYVETDIEALMREEEYVAMREFIKLMERRIS